MDAGVSLARQTRSAHRHELRTLTYVTLDQANGGIVRNLTHNGMGAQVVTPVRPHQQLVVRFELRYPRVRVETRGEVTWATFSGQCGIRFLDLSPRIARQIDQWIFGNLLEAASLRWESSGPIFAGPPAADPPAVEEDDGLLLSAAPRKVIELPLRPEPLLPAPPQPVALEPIHAQPIHSQEDVLDSPAEQLDWLSQPLSGRSLAWTVNSLVVIAAVLLFTLVFLAVTRELPQWPLPMSAGAALTVTALYWGFFRMFGGSSAGTRLARLAGSQVEDEEEEGESRFR